MDKRLFYHIVELSLCKGKLLSKLRPFASRCSLYHNKSWDIESDDEGGRYSRPSYDRNRKWRNDDDFNRNNYFERDDRRKKSNFSGERLSRINWEDVELQTIEKNFYTPSDIVANRSREEIEEFRNKHNMTLLGKNIPNPILEFSDHSFPKEISDIFHQKTFQSPTPIQAQGWPIALSGRDIIGIGQTGSGKTLGYVIPGLMHINHQPHVKPDEGPIGLIIAPTRELVQQIHEVSREASCFTKNKTACLFGGASKNVQQRSLYNRPSLCIATPGRLLDFLEMGATNLKRCTYLVLDEADRMLDMGFEPQIRKIVEQIRPDRQTLMWSATWPKEVEELASDFLTDFIQLNVGSLDLVANPDIEQIVEVCDSFEKRERFSDKLREEMGTIKSKILVFAQTKSQVDFLSRMLHREGIKARGIHGDYSQASRDNTLQGFREGRYAVLVATDVASRGLDVDDISLVVNYDLPTSIDGYIHRIGRTGRAGRAGKSFSLVTESDGGLAKELIRVLKQAKQNVPSDLLELVAKEQEMKSAKRKFRGGGFNRFRPRRENFHSGY